MSLIDLNFIFKTSYIPQLIKLWKGITYEFRSTCLFPSHCSSIYADFQVMCKTLSGKLQSKKFYLSRSISLYGLCTDDFSRKSARYRILPQSPKEQTLSYGNPRRHFPKYVGKCKQSSRLENLFRFCSNTYSNSSSLICRPGIRFRIGKYSLCFGFFDHRSLFERFPLGTFPKSQGSHQTSYTIGFTWQHSNIHSYYRWEASRRKYFGYPIDRTRKLLYYGSRLSGLLSAVYNASKCFFLRYSGQIQSKFSPNIFAFGGQKLRLKVRSDHKAQRLLHCQGLSGKTQTHKVLRFKERSKLRISYKQFCFTSYNNIGTVSLPLAGGAVF